MAIRQDKNYKFNFTLADGSIKTITHSVPLPVASEIGCKGYEYIWAGTEEQYEDFIRVTLSGYHSTDITFSPRKGYKFNTSKNVSFFATEESSSTKLSYINITATSTTENAITVHVYANLGDQTPRDYRIWINATVIKTETIKEEINTNVQNSLNYLYNIIENTKQTTDTFMEPGRVISIDGEQGEIKYSYLKDYSEKIISVLNGKKGSGNSTIKYKLTISDTDFRFKSIEIKNLVDSDVTILTDSCNYEYSYDKNEATITITRTDNQIFDSNKEYNLIVWSYVLFTFESFKSALTRCVKNLSISLPEATLE